MNTEPYIPEVKQEWLSENESICDNVAVLTYTDTQGCTYFTRNIILNNEIRLGVDIEIAVNLNSEIKAVRTK